MKGLTPVCPYCNHFSKLTTGAEIYPHRKYLHEKIFYKCGYCPGVYVGCHAGTAKPLGRLANPELRKAKMKAHAAFDPIWKKLAEKAPKSKARNDAYYHLARKMGIDRKDCHIGMFNVIQCQQVVEICKSGILTCP